jgi:cobalt-zinc-cadmium efflux system membrane fusion protein
MKPFLKYNLVLMLAVLVALSACSRKEAAESHEGHAHAAVSEEAHGTNAAETGSVKMCKEHNVPLVDCGICKPDRIAELKTGESLKVRLASADSADTAGVQIAKPVVGTMAEGIECYAQIAFNQNKLAQISSPVGGIIQEVSADLGVKVEEKQTVAKVWSATLAEAVAKAVLSHQTLDRERKLRADKVTSEKDLQEAEAAHRMACQQLRTLGFSEEQVDEMGGKPLERVLLEIRAPFPGEIVERTAVRGAMVEAGKPLFTMADLTVMWAMLNIPETELARVRTGQAVELRLESLPGKTFTGQLTWIGAEVDERSRMARARVEVPNLEGLLKARMFAQARILTRKTEGAVMVPSTAIQRVEGRTFVFVKLSEDLYDARLVRTGSTYDGVMEVVAGLQSNESVVVNHGYPLKSALLISKLGAGCADD